MLKFHRKSKILLAISVKEVYNNREVINSLRREREVSVMYLNQPVKIPENVSGITRKTIKHVTYVYYAYDRKYDPKKKYSVPKNTTIGKCVEGNPDMMYPNTNFLKFFPDAALPEETESKVCRSSCLKTGAYLVLKKIITAYGLDTMLQTILGKDSDLFLDLAIYTIITENNAAQYYPDYAFNHPLFTQGMRIYSDSKVSDFLSHLHPDQRIAFEDLWNESRDRREKIYLSYDSTNKNCQAGDIDFVEYGRAKEDPSKPIVNYAIAYDTKNELPLFYEDYPGSLVDVSQLQFMLEKAKAYGYRNIGFILDRGYFSKENIHYMDKCGYAFVIMVKGMKELVKDLITEVKGSFEEDYRYRIRDYKVSGITVERQLYPSDKQKRYFHIFYSERKYVSEREALETKIEQMGEMLKKYEGRPERPPKSFSKYFDLIFHQEGTKDETFLCGRELADVINEEVKRCGYFVLITSEKMTAAEALALYKSRDASEKLFRGDKSYLGNGSFRVHRNESMRAKIFVEFVALIIRNRFHTCLRKQRIANGNKQNYLTVPAAIRELEKIEMVQISEQGYRLAHGVTKVQKEILKAFGMTASDIRTEAEHINEKLKSAKDAEANRKAV